MTNNCQLNLFIEINPNFTVMCILVRTASFPRFWRNHPLCRKEWYLIWKGCLFSLRWRKMMFFWGSHFEFFFCCISVKKGARLYEASFFSALLMFFPDSLKRSCPNFYADDCTFKKKSKDQKISLWLYGTSKSCWPHCVPELRFMATKPYKSLLRSNINIFDWRVTLSLLALSGLMWQQISPIVNVNTEQ